MKLKQFQNHWIHIWPYTFLSLSVVEADMVKLLKRYATYDNTDKGTEGIPYDTVVNMPELRAQPFVQPLLDLYVSPSNRVLYPEKFLYFFAVLHKGTNVETKRKGRPNYL